MPKELRIMPFVFLIFLFSCKKSNNSSDPNNLPVIYTPNALEKWFESSVLNRQTIIQKAIDSSGTEITRQFDSFTFMLLKNTYHDGPFLATKSGKTDTGKWLANNDYSKLTLQLKGKPVYEILNIDWKFKTKSTTKLDLIPWFTFHGNRNLVIVPK